ncbi:MAG: septal ring lytic transglycosylase RlpA family protein [Cyclobacteriaceae bacterium]|nr:septal ring lytic transglycosylase RlpA family protein [Cyclobacteriaceae bacterium]
MPILKDIIIIELAKYLILTVAIHAALSAEVYAQTEPVGKASYYADRFEGRKTACGELYCSDSLTAAHRTLPFGTKVKVTHIKNNNCVVVRINDRGPHVPGRTLDLSRKAMELLDGIAEGVIEVKIEIVLEE